MLMRKKFILFALISTMMSICIPATAQHTDLDSLLLRLQELSKIPGVRVEPIGTTRHAVDTVVVEKQFSHTNDSTALPTQPALPPGPKENVPDAGSSENK